LFRAEAYRDKFEPQPDELDADQQPDQIPDAAKAAWRPGPGRHITEPNLWSYQEGNPARLQGELIPGYDHDE
jgi:hypothetical protein